MIPKKQLLLAVLAALASPAMTAPKVEVRIRTLGGEWRTFSSTSGTVKAGAPGSGILLDGLAVDIPGVKAELLPFIEGKKPSRSWTMGGLPAGVAGKRLEGLRLKVDQGTIRYRGFFGGVGTSDWAEDGGPIGNPGGEIYLEAVEVEYRGMTPADTPVEFRAAFQGAGFTPWLKAGSVAEGTGGKPMLTALAIRSALDANYEVFRPGDGWRRPTAEGETAGDPKGSLRVEAIRIFGGKLRLGYRVRLEGKGWTPWCYEMDVCGEPGSGLRIEAVQIAREAAPR